MRIESQQDYRFFLQSPSRLKLAASCCGESTLSLNRRRALRLKRLNFVDLYSSVVDHWHVYDNSLLAIPELILSGEGTRIEIQQEKKWQRLLKLVEKSRE